MGKDIKSFVIGSSEIPEWVNEDTKTGKIRFNFEDDELLNVLVSVRSKIVVGKIGDVILKSKGGLFVVSGEKADEYKIKYNKAKYNQKR